VLDAIHDALDPWLGKPKWKQRHRGHDAAPGSIPYRLLCRSSCMAVLLRGGSMKTSLVFTLLIAMTTCGALADASVAERLNKQEEACDARVNGLTQQVERVALWSNAFTIAGAVVAALGSALAGFLNRRVARRVSALVGALGAVVTVLPQTLPARATLEEALARADRHRTVGRKLLDQIPLLRDEQYIRQCQAYVVARFAECASYQPMAEIPDLPNPPEPEIAATQPVDVGPPPRSPRKPGPHPPYDIHPEMSRE
jgi:hypothetical protein